MSWSKKVSVTYHRIEAAEAGYFDGFYGVVEAMFGTEQMSETFESGDYKYQWELLERLETDNTPLYLFSLVKERKNYPVLVTDGKRSELTIPDGELGDISYGLVCPAYKFILCFGSSTGFKKMLGQFSAEGVVRLTPVFEEGVDEKVLNWDNYKKVSIKMNLHAGEDVTEFTNTKAGELMKMVDFLGGLKVDISVSVGGKETLSNMMVKDLLPELIENDLCTSLIVKGSDFENGAAEQFDIKNATIKYSEQVEIEGNYITDNDVKQILMRALNERASYLFREG